MVKRSILMLILLAMLLGLALPAAAATEPQELPFELYLPAGRTKAAAERLRDNDPSTRLTLTAGQSLTIAWEGNAAGVLLQWYDEKIWYSRICMATIRLYDAAGGLLSEKDYTRLNYRMFLSVRGASRMEIQCKPGSPIASLCEVKVCTPSYTPSNLTGTHQVDLMLILSGVSDELDMLGGLLPLYAGEHGLRTAVVFVGRDDGYRVQEAYQALDAMGLNVIPVFLQREDHETFNIDRLPSLWKENSLRNELVDLFRAYKPQVVVTCDPDDKDSRARSQYTGRIVKDVLVKWGDYKKLEVQKLYTVSSKGQTRLEGRQPLAAYGGRTAVEVAREGYAQYKTEASFRTVIPETPRFALVYTKVGEDEKRNDLFEHLDKALADYQAPAAPEATEAGEPEAAPEATADPNDKYYRQPGEPAEVIVQDYDNGHWEYRSDILSILIDRSIVEENKHTYCRYIAHIRMRDVNSFRSIVTARQETAIANEPPWRLARTHRAVLAITGDNINNADVDLKGILIRSGILYTDRSGDSTMVIGDDMTMRIYHPKEISGLELLDSGVTASYSFGPILVEDGKIHPDIEQHRVFRQNPRCGVGMVEPGHFVAIVTDGRDDQRAYGYTLAEYAQIFVNEGVQLAYNLDGGDSAAMVFMGEHINWHSVGSQRTWADALAWGYSLKVPGANDPIIHKGYGRRY